MASNQSNSSHETFRLFDEKPTSGFGFLDFPEKPLPPPPPCLEVIPSEVSANVKYTMEPVNLDGHTDEREEIDRRWTIKGERVCVFGRGVFNFLIFFVGHVAQSSK
ncbi:histidine protein methyltransferase 1-like protein [Abeliophyllum distichum]|uniref:Histidine protein methyltransferase 1-like protein n=1 Tax=Abeliophyllum distichum TaxID=126358 RepID=A0ABD1SW17_9LAMI